MDAKIYIYRPGQPREEREVNFEPGYHGLKNVVEPLLDGADLEHVTVLFEDKPADMFVDEMGHMKSLPINREATTIYRTNWMKHNPDADPDSLPTIAGTAVVFDRIVWR